MSLPRDHHPRPSNPYTRPARIAGLATAAGLLTGVSGFTALDQRWIVVPILGVVAGSVALILWLAFWISSRVTAKQLRELEGDAALARWMIEPEAWNVFARERRKIGRLLGWLVGGLSLIVGATLGVALWQDGGPVLGASVIGGAVLFALVGSWIGGRAASAGWHVVGAAVPIVIGRTIGAFNGRILSWHGFGHSLREAFVSDEDGVRLMIRGITTGGEAEGSFRFDIPVPPHAAEEAERVAAAIRDHCGVQG